MRKVLVDTDVLINFLRGRKRAKDYLVAAIEDSAICCSAITVAEIYAGMRQTERERTAELLDSLDVLDVTREIAKEAGRYKRDETRQALELDDCLIAATAFVHSALLATGNDRHYPMNDIEKRVVKQ